MKRNIEIKDIKISEQKPVICVPAVAKTHEELLCEIEYLNKTKSEIIEWRADFFNGDIMDELKVISKMISGKKLLFTFRTLPQGGECNCENYFELLANIIETKLVDMIDIEICFEQEKITELVKLAKNAEITSVISSHYFKHTPSFDDICAEFDKMEILGADIPKIAVMPCDFTDVTNFMNAVYETSKKNSPIIGISMGEMGCVTRLCSKHMGSCLSFAAGVSASAPGQLTSEFVSEFINGKES